MFINQIKFPYLKIIRVLRNKKLIDLYSLNISQTEKLKLIEYLRLLKKYLTIIISRIKKMRKKSL